VPSTRADDNADHEEDEEVSCALRIYTGPPTWRLTPRCASYYTTTYPKHFGSTPF